MRVTKGYTKQLRYLGLSKKTNLQPIKSWNAFYYTTHIPKTNIKYTTCIRNACLRYKNQTFELMLSLNWQVFCVLARIWVRSILSSTLKLWSSNIKSLKNKFCNLKQKNKIQIGHQVLRDSSWFFEIMFLVESKSVFLGIYFRFVYLKS